MELANPLLFRQVAIVVMVTTAVLYTAGGKPVGEPPLYHLSDRDDAACTLNGVVVGNACLRRVTEKEVEGGKVVIAQRAD